MAETSADRFPAVHSDPFHHVFGVVPGVFSPSLILHHTHLCCLSTCTCTFIVVMENSSIFATPRGVLLYAKHGPCFNLVSQLARHDLESRDERSQLIGAKDHCCGARHPRGI